MIELEGGDWTTDNWYDDLRHIENSLKKDGIELSTWQELDGYLQAWYLDNKSNLYRVALPVFNLFIEQI